MHNIKFIRENLDSFKKKIKNRNTKVDIDELINFDIKIREIIHKKEKLEQEKKLISKSKDKTQFEKSKKISESIKVLEDNQKKLKLNIDKILNYIPNIPLDDVPSGKDEKSNKVLKTIGVIPKFNFKAKSHYEIGKRLNLMDFDTAAKTSGSRFVFLKGKLAELERAISNFMIRYSHQ